MFSMRESHIPVVEDLVKINREDLENIMETGVFYIKLKHDNHFLNDYDVLRKRALELFRSDDEEKGLFSVYPANTASTKKNILDNGYHDRRREFEHLETFRQFLWEKILPPFDSDINSINNAKKFLVDDLAVDVLKKFLSEFSMNKAEAEKINQMLEKHLRSILSFTYYSQRSFIERMTRHTRFNPHKDINLLTILLIEKPGLQFWGDGHWIDVHPKDGYALAMFGYDTELITNGGIRSSLHTVKTHGNEERLSTIFFVSVKEFIPFLSNKGDVICDQNSLPMYRDRYKKHNFSDKTLPKSEFAKAQLKFNVIFFALLNLFLSTKYQNSILRFENMYSMVLFNIIGFAILNASIYLFKQTHFERMFMDYLQYTDKPEYVSLSKKNAYDLGKASLSMLGMFKSFIEPDAYSHSSHWNAGFMRSFIKK